MAGCNFSKGMYEFDTRVDNFYARVFCIKDMVTDNRDWKLILKIEKRVQVKLDHSAVIFDEVVEQGDWFSFFIEPFVHVEWWISLPVVRGDQR